MIPARPRPRERRTHVDPRVALARSLAAWDRPQSEINAALGGASIEDLIEIRKEDSHEP